MTKTIKTWKELARAAGCGTAAARRRVEAGLLPSRRRGGWDADELATALSREDPLIRRPGRPGRPSLAEIAAAQQKGGA